MWPASAAPMLPVDLFKRPLFALSALTAVCTFAAQGLAFVSLPFYFEVTLGRSPIETGFLMTPWAALVAVMAPIAGRLSDRYSPGALGGIGLALRPLQSEEKREAGISAGLLVEDAGGAAANAGVQPGDVFLGC